MFDPVFTNGSFFQLLLQIFDIFFIQKYLCKKIKFWITSYCALICYLFYKHLTWMYKKKNYFQTFSDYWVGLYLWQQLNLFKGFFPFVRWLNFQKFKNNFESLQITTCTSRTALSRGRRDWICTGCVTAELRFRNNASVASKFSTGITWLRPLRARWVMDVVFDASYI